MKNSIRVHMIVVQLKNYWILTNVHSIILEKLAILPKHLVEIIIKCPTASLPFWIQDELQQRTFTQMWISYSHIHDISKTTSSRKYEAPTAIPLTLSRMCLPTAKYHHSVHTKSYYDSFITEELEQIFIQKPNYFKDQVTHFWNECSILFSPT